jgi:hypothetical protein
MPPRGLVHDWLTLIVAALGIGGTLAGTVLAQHSARKSDRERFAHEDATRTFDHRRSAYFDYLQEWEGFRTRLADAQEMHEYDQSLPDEPPHDWLMPLWNRLLAIRVYGTAAAYAKAEAAYDALSAHAFGNRGLDQEPLDAFIAQVRVDLAVPG